MSIGFNPSRYEEGSPCGVCAERSCHNEPAVAFNRTNGLWYCRSCAKRVNEEHEKETGSKSEPPMIIAG